MKLKRENRGNCKLTDSEIKEIQDLYQQGTKIYELAKLFKVNSVTIRYWISDETRDDIIKRNVKFNRVILSDPLMYKKHKQQSLASYYKKKKILGRLFTDECNKKSLELYHKKNKKI